MQFFSCSIEVEQTYFLFVLLQAHEVAMLAWNENASNGLLAQCYAYAKKMAGYFLEIIKQCLERAIRANGLEMTEAEKNEINDLLDDILP